MIIELRLAELYGLGPGRGDMFGEMAGTLLPRAWPREPKGEPNGDPDCEGVAVDSGLAGSWGPEVGEGYPDSMGDEPAPRKPEVPPAPIEAECFRFSLGRPSNRSSGLSAKRDDREEVDVTVVERDEGKE